MQAAKRYVKMRAAIFIYAAIPVFLLVAQVQARLPVPTANLWLSAEPRRASFDVCAALLRKNRPCVAQRGGWAEVRSLSPPHRPTRKERPEPPAPWGCSQSGSFHGKIHVRCGGNELLSPLPEIDLERARAVVPGIWAGVGLIRAWVHVRAMSRTSSHRSARLHSGNLNTTPSLLLERDKLLSATRRYPAHVVPMWSSHNTAVLEELATVGYGIDSWYGPKGSPARFGAGPLQSGRRSEQL